MKIGFLGRLEVKAIEVTERERELESERDIFLGHLEGKAYNHSIYGREN